IVAYIRALQESQNISEEELAGYDVDLSAMQQKTLDEQAEADSVKASRETEAPPEASATLGKEVITANGCTACHNEDGSAGGIGPTWAGLYGSEGDVITEDGETVTVTKDEDYLRESIVAPEAAKPVDYAQGVMVSYSYLSDQEIESIILYIKNLEN
ncbi:MAG: cytochrome c, partial [Gracilimonas sp.]